MPSDRPEHPDGREQKSVNREDVFEAAIKAWGEPSQIDLAIEELGELITELARYQNGRSSASEDAVREEIADCRIALDQLKRIFGPKGVAQQEAEKMCRLDERVADAGGYHD